MAADPMPPLHCDPLLRTRVSDHLAAHAVRAVPLDERKRAAVAVVLTSADDDPRSGGGALAVPAAFLLCRRATRLNRHGGQWALPGGRLDIGESAEEAALRELDEELGVALTSDAVLGRLDDYPTRSGYVITPVVLWAGPDIALTPSIDEVAAVHRVPLSELQRDDSPRFVTIPESDRPVVQIPIGDSLIHAPTGAVLLQFRWVAVDGRAGERVDELEQPVFAWR